jgi:hypothetical protein
LACRDLSDQVGTFERVKTLVFLQRVSESSIRTSEPNLELFYSDCPVLLHSLPNQTMDSLVSMSKLNCSPSPPDCSRISGPRSILHLPQRQAVQPVSLERKRALGFAMALMVFSRFSPVSHDTFPKAFTTKHSNSPSDSRASVPERRNKII